MFRPTPIASLVLTLACTGAVLGQQQQSGPSAQPGLQAVLPPDLSRLPAEIRELKWQTIDVSTLPPLERCRALMLMNKTLDELSANVTAEADLMSTYLEKENLGQTFASTPAPLAPPAIGYLDAEKISVALLRGPMKASDFGSDLKGLDPAMLKGYAEMYSRTCARRWGEFEESRHLVRTMSWFLHQQKKLPDYDAWATAESARREFAAQQRAEAAPSAAKAAAAAKQNLQAEVRQQQLELSQMNAALVAAHAQQQQQQQPAAPAQPAAAGGAGAPTTVTPGGQPAQAVNGGYVVGGDDYGYAYGGYGGYGYAYDAYGAAAAGAVAGARAADTAGQYHSANATWARQAAYSSDARAQTEARMSSFHGMGGRR